MAETYIYKDLAFQPKLNAQGDISYVTDIDAIKQSITQILNTRIGERVMRPTFGSTVHSIIFDLADNFLEDRLIDAVVSAINIWEPRVTVSDVEVFTDIDNHEYTIRLFIDIIGLTSFSATLDIEIRK